jgi:TRAP-type C4-dicarboxylate transport system permease small subunit
MKEIELAPELHLQEGVAKLDASGSAVASGDAHAGPPLTGLLTAINAPVARFCMVSSVAGLLVIVVIVFWQVFGRYVLNSSPTWTESLALILVLYVTLIGAAVGVRDAGHIGMESLLVLASDRIRNRIELLIHFLVMIFGAAMIYNGLVLGSSVSSYKIPNLGLPEAIRYAPLVLSGVLIISFSIEHVIALVQGKEVVPSWH